VVKAATQALRQGMGVRVEVLVELAVLLEQEIHHQLHRHKETMAARNIPADLTEVLAVVVELPLLALRLRMETALMVALAHPTRIPAPLSHMLAVEAAGLMVVAREQLAAQAVRVAAVMEPHQEPRRQEPQTGAAAVVAQGIPQGMELLERVVQAQ
jgi:hypothetical protein